MPQKMFRLTDEQICKLKKVSELRGCSQTDLIRGFIDSLDEEPPDTQGDTHRDTQEIHGDERSSGADSPALAALIDQLAKKDEQIAKLMETVADSTKAVHLARARTVQEFDDPDGAWRNKDGAPTKADLVRRYAAEHPDANHSEIARALGISRPTVIKWLKDVPEGATEPEKPKPDDLYELYDPAMVELRAVLDEYWSSANDRGYLSPPQSAITGLELAQKAIGLDTGVEEYWKRADAENGKR